MYTIEKRYSSPTSSPRPRTFRKRSNSFPISEALGCSTPEAELILAEGRAAVRTRMANRQRGRRREEIETFRPKDHISYLSQPVSVVPEAIEGSSSSPPQPRAGRHSRVPSNASNASDATERSTSTLVATARSSTEETLRGPGSPSSPLGDYSAHLANFIKDQLKSIPTYRAGVPISPQSCPDMPTPRSRPQSPVKSMRRHVDAPALIEIPPVRPPARSAFSAWSSTDDDTDDEAPAMPDADASYAVQRVENYTPSVLGYYEQPNDSTFLFPSTPNVDEDPDTAKGTSFPNNSKLPGMADGFTDSVHEEDYPSDFSRLSLVTSSSAPSMSSNSTGSYFEFRMPFPQKDDVQDKPMPSRKIIPAISPFEGSAFSHVHDIFVQSQQRVLVDGMSFDMVRDFTIPASGTRAVQTPC